LAKIQTFCLFCLFIIFLLFILFWLSDYTVPTVLSLVVSPNTKHQTPNLQLQLQTAYK
jgi:hypothetical protein